MMIKKRNNIIIGLLTLVVIICTSISIPTFAEDIIITQGNSISGSLINKSGAIISLVAVDNRTTNYLDLTNYSNGTVTINFGRNSYGAYLISSDDMPNDLAIGYTFISDDFHTITNESIITIHITSGCYIYVSYNRSYTTTFVPDDEPPVEPTPTNTPTPIPIITGGNSIPLDYDIPFDYYMIAIIILLGGILICQFFKN